MVRIFLCLTIFFGISTVASADMPRYDVSSHCDAIARFGGNYSATMYDGCFEMEQAAYNSLKSRWDSLNSALRSHCNDIATFASPGSYSMLEGCVMMEEQASSTNNTFDY